MAQNKVTFSKSHKKILKQQRHGRTVNLNDDDEKNEKFSDTSIIYGDYDDSDKEIKDAISEDSYIVPSVLSNLSMIGMNNDSVIGGQERSPRSLTLL